MSGGSLSRLGCFCLHCTAPIVDRSLLHSLSISDSLPSSESEQECFHGFTFPFSQLCPPLASRTRPERDRVAGGVGQFSTPRAARPPRMRVFCCFPEVVGPGWAGPRVASRSVPLTYRSRAPRDGASAPKSCLPSTFLSTSSNLFPRDRCETAGCEIKQRGLLQK
jgi:hypothetical protein